jgi:hypothetical protein
MVFYLFWVKEIGYYWWWEWISLRFEMDMDWFIDNEIGFEMGIDCYVVYNE